MPRERLVADEPVRRVGPLVAGVVVLGGVLEDRSWRGRRRRRARRRRPASGPGSPSGRAPRRRGAEDLAVAEGARAPPEQARVAGRLAVRGGRDCRNAAASSRRLTTALTSRSATSTRPPARRRTPRCGAPPRPRAPRRDGCQVSRSAMTARSPVDGDLLEADVRHRADLLRQFQVSLAVDVRVAAPQVLRPTGARR